MPQLTAHVCGVCPAAHHLASVRALDALYGASPPPAALRAQALYYNLFVFEDHLLHYWYMGGPDFYAAGAPAPMRNVLGVLARVGRDLGGRILSARREARELMAALAGRAVHPVFALPGGISRPLDAATVERAREVAPGLVRFAADTLASFRAAVLDDPRYAEALRSEIFRVRCHSMGMVDADGRLTFLDGRLRVIDPDGAELATFEPRDWLDHLAERVEPWTYAKLTFLKAKGWTGLEEGPASGLYRVGPLARLNVARAMATPRAEAERQRLFDALGWPAHQTLAFHWARLVEALQAAESVEALAHDPALGRTRGAARARAARGPARGRGRGGGAPRHALPPLRRRPRRAPHRGEPGGGLAAQRRAGPDLGAEGGAGAHPRRGVDPALLNQLEMAFRAYDPCNACASHALPGELPLVVTLRGPDGAVREVIRRRVAEDEG